MAAISFKTTHPDVKHPGFAHKYDAGIDLFFSPKKDAVLPIVNEKLEFQPFEIKLLGTGLIFKIPNNCVGIIKDRSGIALKTTLTVRAGVIDPTYRGEVGIVMQNVSDKPAYLDISKPVAQMLICSIPNTVRLDFNPYAINSTDRGDSGFGSTDIHFKTEEIKNGSEKN